MRAPDGYELIQNPFSARGLVHVVSVAVRDVKDHLSLDSEATCPGRAALCKRWSFELWPHMDGGHDNPVLLNEWCPDQLICPSCLRAVSQLEQSGVVDEVNAILREVTL